MMQQVKTLSVNKAQCGMGGGRSKAVFSTAFLCVFVLCWLKWKVTRYLQIHHYPQLTELCTHWVPWCIALVSRNMQTIAMTGDVTIRIDMTSIFCTH